MWVAGLWNFPEVVGRIGLTLPGMGRRHHTTPKKTRGRHAGRDTGRRRHAADHREVRRVPWTVTSVAEIQTRLAGAHDELGEEWYSYLLPLQRRMSSVEAMLEDLDESEFGAVDDQDRLIGELGDIVEMIRLASLRAVHSVNAVDTLERITPIWVPEHVLTCLGEAPRGEPGVTTAVAELGPAGLLLFEKSPQRFREILPADAPEMPEVDVDGILWWTKENAPLVVVAPLTRSRDLDWIRGAGWKRSVLVEATCFDVPLAARRRFNDADASIVELMQRIGKALQDNVISVRSDGDSDALGDNATTPPLRLLDVA